VTAVLDARDVGSLVLDVRGVQFLDSSGLRALLVCRDRTQEAGAEFRLAVAPGPVSRLLAVAGVQGWFDYE
jgi:anti-anti-sigma factor